MKTLIASAAAICGILAVAAEPEITGLSVTQNSSRLVTIDFTLSERAIVTFDMTTNGATIGPDNYRLLHDAQSDSMDYPANKVLSAGRHVFMWRSAVEWPNHVFTNGEFAVELKAFSLSSPPDYMVLDLATQSNRWFYASAAELPYGGIKTADTNDTVAIDELTNDVYRTTKLVMRRIPAAGNKWRMGSPTNETQWRDAHEVLHYVTLTEDYYLGIYPLVKWQSHIVAKNTSYSIVPYNNTSYVEWRGEPSSTAYNWPDNGHEVNPANTMKKFRDYTGLEIDFPTEAQWEYACRAGTSGAYNDNSSNGRATGWSQENTSKVMPVGLLKPNAWGLYDMHGLVWEWCLDQFQAHPSTPQIDPPGATTNISRRVTKGGTYATSLVRGRSAARRNRAVTDKSDGGLGGFMGVRFCCPISGVAE